MLTETEGTPATVRVPTAGPSPIAIEVTFGLPTNVLEFTVCVPVPPRLSETVYNTLALTAEIAPLPVFKIIVISFGAEEYAQFPLPSVFSVSNTIVSPLAKGAPDSTISLIIANIY